MQIGNRAGISLGPTTWIELQNNKNVASGNLGKLARLQTNAGNGEFSATLLPRKTLSIDEKLAGGFAA